MSEPDTRATIARIIAESGASAGPEADDDAAEPAAEAPAVEQEAAEPEAEAAEPEQAAATPGGRPRGPDGKFAPVVAPAAAGKPAPPPAPDALKPPADWSPKAIAHWEKLPREVQEEGLRLHVETKKLLEERAKLRQTAEGWQGRLAPYEPIFRTAGVDPAQGVQNVLGIYAQLVTGAPDVRQRVAAELIKQFVGTDEASLRALAAHLEAQPPAPQTLRPEQVTDVVRKQFEQRDQQARQQAESAAFREFEDGKPEFIGREDVIANMKRMVLGEKAAGGQITATFLKQAYESAVKLSPEAAAILKQRDDAAAAKANAAEAAKKAAAASGIRNEPAGPSGSAAKAGSTRDEVKRQMDRLSGRARV